MDETLGFLLFALKKQKALPFWGPAYTAHLEVEYKAVSCSCRPLQQLQMYHSLHDRRPIECVVADLLNISHIQQVDPAD